MSAFTSMLHSVQDRFPTPSSWNRQGTRLHGQTPYWFMTKNDQIDYFRPQSTG